MLYKDQPSPSYRLNIETYNTTIIDPLIPIELIVSDFKYGVGIGSIALLPFGERGICIVNLIKEHTSHLQLHIYRWRK